MRLIPVEIPGDQLINFETATYVVAHGYAAAPVSFLYKDSGEIGSVHLPDRGGDPYQWMLRANEARSKLIEALRQAEISAYAFLRGGRDLRRIPVPYWTTPQSNNPLMLLLGVVDGDSPEVLVDRSEVDRWRSLKAVFDHVDIGARLPFDRASKWPDLVKWYRSRVAAAPVAGYTRKEDEDAAKAVGIARDRARELRKEHAPDHWSKDGPKAYRN